MPRNKKPRKPYRPVLRTPGALPMVYALSESAKTELALGPQACLLKLQLGLVESYDIETIGTALNIAAASCDRFDGGCAEAKATITAGVHALDAVRKLERTIGRYEVSGDELRALGVALELADKMRDLSTRRELRDCLERLRRIAASPAGQQDLVELEAVAWT